MTKKLPKTHFARNKSNLLVLDLSDRLELKLINEDKSPVASMKYQIQRTDKTLVNGTLDKDGYALVEEENLDGATVTFPDFDAEDWMEEKDYNENNKSEERK